MDKLSSDEYNFTVDIDEKGAHIVLNQVSSGKKKVFFIAGSKSPDSITGHMNTLTDELCEQWFAERNHGKKKKKKDAE